MTPAARQERFDFDLDERVQSNRHVRLYRSLLIAGGFVYLSWWLVIAIVLPNSFNPLLSRAAVAACFWAVVLASFRVASVARHMGTWFAACAWLVTGHFYFLFYNTQADANWTVRTYVLVIAIVACMQSRRALLAYGAFVLCLTAGLTWVGPMRHTVFLPGMLTILAFEYYGLRTRLRLVTQVQQYARQVQDLFDASFEGIIVHDRGVILNVNESAARLFGYPREAMIGTHVADHTAPETKSTVLASIEAGVETPYEAVAVRADGSFMPVEIWGKRFRLHNRPVRISAVRDLTEVKKSERERVMLAASQEGIKVRDEFMSVASHELKTPLTHMKLQVQMAKRALLRPDSCFGPKEMLRLINGSEHQIGRLIRLVGDMLDMSQLGLAKLEITPERVDVTALVERVAGSVEDSPSPVTVTGDADAVVSADPFRLEQVVLNLLSNTMKYGLGRPVHITVQRLNGTVRLAVRDQGMGIAKEHHQRIFNRFERAVSARNISGLGLGLFISNQIVAAHHGRMTVESELGKGATFVVELPSWQDAPRVAPTVAPREQPDAAPYAQGRSVPSSDPIANHY